MTKSQRLRWRELRSIYELIGECRELGVDPLAWRTHLAARTRELVRSQIAIYTESDIVGNPGERGWLQINVLLDDGWPCESDRRAMFRLYETEQPDMEGSPLTTEFATSGSPRSVADRQQQMNDQDWYRGLFFNEYMRPAHLDDAIMLRFRSGNEVRLLVLQRSLGDRHFERRELRLLRVLGVEYSRHFGRSLVPLGGLSVTELPPRLRKVLYHLLDGDSEKQIALRLNLSRHTVHDYVKMLHARFGVRSRGELLARSHPLRAVLQRACTVSNMDNQGDQNGDGSERTFGP